MPIYEYQCQACGHSFDILQKISDAVLQECPECQQAKLQKLVSAPGFQLKGSGWYVTDFRNKKAPDESKTNSSTTDSNTADKTPVQSESKVDKTDTASPTKTE